jgi:HAMP domain-containing protein
MTAKEFLRQARDADRRIDEAMERLERTRARLEAGRMSNLTGMPRGGAVDWTKTADRVIELEKRVNARIREMVRQKQAAMDAIDRVEEARLREVLELYYLDGFTWEQVAEQMQLDQRWVYRLHGKALQRIVVPKDLTIESQS